MGALHNLRSWVVPYLPFASVATQIANFINRIGVSAFLAIGTIGNEILSSPNKLLHLVKNNLTFLRLLFLFYKYHLPNLYLNIKLILSPQIVRAVKHQCGKHVANTFFHGSFGVFPIISFTVFRLVNIDSLAIRVLDNHTIVAEAYLKM
mgnify:CR=1 FL=1